MKWLCALMLLGLLLCCGRASAQTCTATASNIDFGNVSPISGASVPGSGSILVTCTWTLISLAPNVQVCANLAASSPRLLANGSNTMLYDLYTDSGHSVSWGSTASGGTPLSVSIGKPLLGTTNSATLNFYGLVGANQQTVPSVANSNTVYSQNFAGTQTVLAYEYYTLLPPACSAISAPTTTFPFTASATVVNNCTITATNLAFGTVGVLNHAITGNTNLSVRCTNGDAWRISLNGGGSGNVAARTMQRTGGGGSIQYQLYTDANRTVPWGDGSGGTSRATGTGTGNAQSVAVYGGVPIQTTPLPGSYSDTITATIEF